MAPTEHNRDIPCVRDPRLAAVAEQFIARDAKIVAYRSLNIGYRWRWQARLEFSASAAAMWGCYYEMIVRFGSC